MHADLATNLPNNTWVRRLIKHIDFNNFVQTMYNTLQEARRTIEKSRPSIKSKGKDKATLRDIDNEGRTDGDKNDSEGESKGKDDNNKDDDDKGEEQDE